MSACGGASSPGTAAAPSTAGVATTAAAAPGASGFCGLGAAQFSAKVDRDALAKRSQAEQNAELEAFKASAPPDIAADTAVIVDSVTSEAGGTKPSQADIDRGLAAGKRVLEYVVSHCPEGVSYWSCLGPRQHFKQVGTAIGDGPGQPPPSEVTDSGATPDEAAVRSETSYPPAAGAKRVELSRSDTSVMFAWVSADGRARQLVVVKQTGSRWTAGRTSVCRP